MRAELPHIAADILMRLRARGPRVHCITNAVAQTFTANTLLAAGAVPSMTLAADEIGAFVARADGLLVNLGTFDAERRAAAAAALEVAAERRIPWVLDPVFIDRSAARADYAKSLVAQKPNAVRLNGAEFAALSGSEPEDAALAAYARDTRAVMALTGTVDRITDGAQQHRDRERPSADGARHRHGLRGLGFDGGVSERRERCVQGDGVGAVVLRRRGRARGRARERAGELSGGAARCALCARQAHAHREGARDMIDLRLNAIVDPERADGRSLAELTRLVVAGGATLIQLRDKLGSTRRMIEEARAIMAVLAGTGVPLVINDRVDVALAAGADGVHVGQDDMAAADARRLLGPTAIIGLSIKSVALANAAPLEAIDYAGIGGVYATTSKDNPDPPIGVAGLRAIIAALRARRQDFPVCGIAGIDARNAAPVIEAGADGVAVISALSMQPDPKAPRARCAPSSILRCVLRRGHR